MIIESLNCLGCGAPINIKEKKCDYCKQEVVIKNFKTIKNKKKEDVSKYLNFYKSLVNTNGYVGGIEKSIGLCSLKLGLYVNSINNLKKYVENNVNDSEALFYLAIALLNGKKPFVTSRKIIDEIIENIEAAILIDDKAIYKYFYSYIKFDFFKRKSYKTSPTYDEILDDIYGKVSEEDIEEMFETLNTNRPSEM